jgi:hypothetical protein
MATLIQVPELVRQKLAAFEAIQAEFEEGFRFIEEVHGQRRFSAFSVADVVFYLHSLWLCELKDRLLGIYKNGCRYEGSRCLKLLQAWQEGRSTKVVDFLMFQLDKLPFAEITAQIEEASRQEGDEAARNRLEHGRMVLLNRGMNLMSALEAIFSPRESSLLAEVREACEQSHHLPAQIEEQLAELATPLYAFQSHKLLARQNMVIMNKLALDVLVPPADEPGARSRRVLPARERQTPFAEQIIDGYRPLLAPVYNNLRRVRFIDQVAF